MTVTVVELGADDDAAVEWDAYVDGHPDATPYHRSAWRRIFGEGLGYAAHPLLARDETGRPAGILPLFRVRGLAGSRLVAVPFRDRGGPLADDEAGVRALIAEAARLTRERDCRALVLKATRPYPVEVAEAAGLVRTDHWVHSSLALEGSEKQAWHDLGGKTRNMIRQARNHGLECSVVTGEADAAARWRALHLATQRRLGVPPFPAAFFAAMLRELGPAGRLELLEVRRGREAAAATLLLFHRTTCIYGYSASTEEGQRLRANDLMLFEAMSLARRRGVKTFDLGSDSPCQESLLFFKRKWGAVQATIPTYTLGGTSMPPDSSSARYTLARNALRLLPSPLFDAVGSRLTPYFG
jgi:CelD/BcsL family acetyltransferase involved in cellulose biosynthesis